MTSAYRSTRSPRRAASVAALCLAAAVAVAAATSCSRSNFVRPMLPETPLLVGSNPFGVIKVSYAKGFAETNLDSLILCIHRAGDIVDIVKRSPAQEKLNGVVDYWYQVKSGDQLSWVFGSWMDQFALDIQARTAADIIRGKAFPQTGSTNPR